MGRVRGAAQAKKATKALRKAVKAVKRSKSSKGSKVKKVAKKAKKLAKKQTKKAIRRAQKKVKAIKKKVCPFEPAVLCARGFELGFGHRPHSCGAVGGRNGATLNAAAAADHTAAAAFAVA